MSVTDLLMTTTGAGARLDASKGESTVPSVSDFVTIQSLANFAAMTGAISAAWSVLKLVAPQWFLGYWVPLALAGLFGIVSVLISLNGLKSGDPGEKNYGNIAAAVFIAFLNALVLASAVIGAAAATNAALPAN